MVWTELETVEHDREVHPDQLAKVLVQLLGRTIYDVGAHQAVVVHGTGYLHNI